MVISKHSVRPILVLLLVIFWHSVHPSLIGAESANNPSLSPKAAGVLQGVHRIVFLGDSITQAGDYVTDIECWLVSRGAQIEVLNLGLASETASDLTAQENAEHLRQFGFGRPFVSQRLDRALAATRPDILFACYGMNDSGALPRNAVGDERFAQAITNLRAAAEKAGAKRVVICTPPIFDNKKSLAENSQDQTLARYTTWLLSKRASGWDIVDIHTPMRRALDEERVKNPDFKFAGDGVHPGRQGHWLMAREILIQSLGAELDDVASAEGLFPAHGTEIRNLIHQRMVVLFDAWMSQIGHSRPGVSGGPGVEPGPTVASASEQAASLTKQVRLLTADK